MPPSHNLFSSDIILLSLLNEPGYAGPYEAMNLFRYGMNDTAPATFTLNRTSEFPYLLVWDGEHDTTIGEHTKNHPTFYSNQPDSPNTESIQLAIGTKIHERRIAINMSVDELADKIGRDRATVYRYENGKIENMPIGLLVPLAKALDVTVEYLLGTNQQDRPPQRTPEIDIFKVIIRLHEDLTFRKIVENIYTLDGDRLVAFQKFLMAFGDK